MIRRIYSTLLLFVILLGGLAHTQTSQAQTQSSDETVFLLPTREERLIQDAQDKQTPVSQLVEMLKDSSYKVRLAAVRALGMRGDSNVLPALEATVKAEHTQQWSPGNQERIEAAVDVARTRILASTQEEANQISQLVSFLKSPDATKQLEGILALGDYQNKAATDALLDYLKTHDAAEWSYIYLRALTQLVERDKKASLPYIEAYFAIPADGRHDTGGVGRERITDPEIDELAELYWEMKLQNLSPLQKVDLLVNTLTDQKSSPSVLTLRNELAKSGPTIFPRLRALAKDKKTADYLRQLSIELLGIMKDVESANILFSIFSDKQETEVFQEAAFQALINIKNPRAVSILKQRLNSFVSEKNSYKLANSLWAAHDIAIQGVNKSYWEEAILPYVNKGNVAAAIIIRDIGGIRSMDALINFISDSADNDNNNGLTKLMALASLETLASLDREKVKEYSKYLIQYDTDAMIRVKAAQILAQTGDKSVVPIIYKTLKSESDGLAIRYEVSALYAIGGKQAVEALEELKSSQDQISNPNKQLLEWVNETLLRLEREKRTDS